MSKDEKFTYKGSIDCTGEMKTSLKNYLEMDKELAGFISDLKSVENQKEESEGECEAEEIWNSS